MVVLFTETNFNLNSKRFKNSKNSSARCTVSVYVGCYCHVARFLKKIFYWPFQGGASFVGHFCYLVLLCFRAGLFIDALRSTAGKGLTYWLSFVMSNCEVVTFPLVSWVRCGAWLHWFPIFSLFLTLVSVGAVRRTPPLDIAITRVFHASLSAQMTI